MSKFDDYFDSLKKVENLDIEKLKNAMTKPTTKGIRINTQKINFDDFDAKSTKNIQNICKNIKRIIENDGIFENIPWCVNGFYCSEESGLGKSIFHEMGLYYIQEPSAMSPVEFLDVKPNDVVLDLCASPGGKSTQIANKITGNGFLVANEIVSSRAKVLMENIIRLGIDNTIVINHSPKEIEDRFENFFDKILVDAPCSGEGMFRKNPDAINEWQTTSPAQCATRQKEIVSSAYKMLKADGIMVYSTCTFSIEENEEIINFLLEKFDDMEVLPINHEQYNFERGIIINSQHQLKNCVRLYPYNINGEGHFFAVLHKKCKKNTIFKQKNHNFDTNNKKFFKKQDILIFEKFANEHNLKKFDNYVSLGNKLYTNCKIGIDKLKVLCPGLCLGEIKNNIFIPDYHLAKNLCQSKFKPFIEISKDDTKKYIEGYEINTTQNNGWVLLTHKGFSVAFGKCVDGKIKNHYPKHLRKHLL